MLGKKWSRLTIYQPLPDGSRDSSVGGPRGQIYPVSLPMHPSDFLSALGGRPLPYLRSDSCAGEPGCVETAELRRLRLFRRCRRRCARSSSVTPNSLQWRQFGAKVVAMPSVQIKNVPPDVHRVLRRRAATAGQSMQEYLLAALKQQAQEETLDEVLDRAGERAGGSLGFSFAVATLRDDRQRAA